MKKKVLQFIHGFNMGGAEALVKDYCLNLDKEKYEVSVLCFYRYHTPYEKMLEDGGIKVTYISDIDNRNEGIGVKRLGAVFDLFRRCCFIRQFIRNEAPDILHTHLAVNSYVAFAGPKKGTKIIHTVHNEPKVLWNRSFSRRLDLKAAHNLVKKYQMRFITLHEEMKQEVNELFGVDDSVVLNNGIDFSRFDAALARDTVREREGIPSDAFVVGHIGRFGVQKNHKFLIDVFAKIHEKNEKAFLILIGNGKLQPEIERQLKELGLEKCSKILSYISDIPDLLGAMDRFVFPSIFEGLGIVLIEAQKAGLSCIVSDAVPKAAIVSNLVKQLDLKFSADQWAEETMNWNVDSVKYCGIEDWDMKRVILRLEEIYNS